MIFAEGGIFGAVAIVMVIGFFGFFFFAALALFRFAGAVFRRVFFWDVGRDNSLTDAANLEPNTTCRNPLCRHLNVPTARYCARCGQRLAGAERVDQHG